MADDKKLDRAAREWRAALIVETAGKIYPDLVGGHDSAVDAAAYIVRRACEHVGLGWPEKEGGE